MIKGKFVATLVIDINIDDNQPGMRPFDEIKKDFNNGFIDKELVAIITDELGEGCAVGLTRQYADLYKVEDNKDGN